MPYGNLTSFGPTRYNSNDVPDKGGYLHSSHDEGRSLHTYDIERAVVDVELVQEWYQFACEKKGVICVAYTQSLTKNDLTNTVDTFQATLHL